MDERASSSVPPPGQALAAPAQPASGRESFYFEFTGNGAEYFRVWIVNVALTILTLGIYSAWAKVRNKQYFYGNARLAGGSFEYTADPLNILKGRLLVFGALVAYAVAEHFAPPLALAMFLALVPLIPWVVIRAVNFNHRYSSYRGLRFHFDGRYWEAFKVYILWTLVIVISFGLAYPYVAWRRKQFLVDRSRYGRSPFAFSGEAGWFYVVYIVGSLVYTGVLLVGALLVGGGIGLAAITIGADAESTDVGETGKILAVVLLVLVYAGFLLSFVVLNAGIQAMISNHVWQRTRVSDVQFDLRLDLWRVIWIQVSNIVAIIFSVGMLIPWARVRMVRYWLSRFTMIAAPAELERFVAAERERISATGDELGDALDLDLGL